MLVTPENLQTVLPITQETINIPPMPVSVAPVSGLPAAVLELMPPPYDLFDAHIPARGNRIFHALRSSSFANVSERISLKRKDRKLIQTVIAKDIKDEAVKREAVKQCHTIDYSQFSKLWLKLHGPDSIITRGSHRSLMDSAGNTIGSTFAHDEAQQYTHKTIRYLADALFEAGKSNVSLAQVMQQIIG